jgi:hypothetical protein
MGDQARKRRHPDHPQLQPVDPVERRRPLHPPPQQLPNHLTVTSFIVPVARANAPHAARSAVGQMAGYGAQPAFSRGGSGVSNAPKPVIPLIEIRPQEYSSLSLSDRWRNGCPTFEALKASPVSRQASHGQRSAPGALPSSPSAASRQCRRATPQGSQAWRCAC